MRRVLRLLATGTAVGLTTAVAACGAQTPQGPEIPPTSEAPTTVETTGDDEGGPDGGTELDEVYGSSCDLLPASGEGSVEAMADDPAGRALTANPELSTLVKAAQAANLLDRLNDPNSSYTVFAPANSAFEALPDGTLDRLMADPGGELSDILAYHLVPRRYDAEGLVVSREVTTAQGAELSITGDAGSLTVDEQEQASLLCGNIPTSNATIFIIDKVLMPPTG